MGQQQMGTGWEQRERRRGKEIKKQNKNKQQRPCDSPGGRRHVKPRDVATSAHVLKQGYQARPETRGWEGGMSEEGPWGCVPSGHT